MKVIDLKEAQVFFPAGPHSTLLADEPAVRYLLFCFEAGQSVPPHNAMSTMSLTVLAGEGFVMAGAREIVIAPGTMVLFEGNEPYVVTARTRLVALAAITPRPG